MSQLVDRLNDALAASVEAKNYDAAKVLIRLIEERTHLDLTWKILITYMPEQAMRDALASAQAKDDWASIAYLCAAMDEKMSRRSVNGNAKRA